MCHKEIADLRIASNTLERTLSIHTIRNWRLRERGSLANNRARNGGSWEGQFLWEPRSEISSWEKVASDPQTSRSMNQTPQSSLRLNLWFWPNQIPDGCGLSRSREGARARENGAKTNHSLAALSHFLVSLLSGGRKCWWGANMANPIPWNTRRGIRLPTSRRDTALLTFEPSRRKMCLQVSDVFWFRLVSRSLLMLFLTSSVAQLPWSSVPRGSRHRKKDLCKSLHERICLTRMVYLSANSRRNWL